MIFDFSKKPLKFEQILEHALDACIDYAREYNTSRLLSLVPPQEQGDLFKRFTHLQSDDFFVKRRELYRKIFLDTFTRNGHVIAPETKQEKRRLIFAGTFFKGKWELLDLLQKKDKSVPALLQREFDKVNNARSITVNLMKVMKALPEYQQLLKSGYAYPEVVVGGEVAAICRSMLNAAKICGYNIIDASSSHTTEKSDKRIEVMQGIQRKDLGMKRSYKLVSIGVTGSKEVIEQQVEDHKKHAKPSSVKRKMAIGLRDFASGGSFPKLMEQSHKALLMWDAGPDKKQGRFSVVAKALEGNISYLNHERWNEFKSHKHLELEYENSAGRNYVLQQAQKSDKQSKWRDVASAHDQISRKWAEKELEKEAVSTKIAAR